MADNPPHDRYGSAAAPPIVVLTGFMGSGKTTTGRALAELLHWDFVDLDEWIEAQEQVSIRELFERAGEAAFREIEHRALRRALDECSRPTVLSLGGGTFAQPNNGPPLTREGLRTVFLEVPLEEMMRRCGDDEGVLQPRPLASDPVSFRKLYEERVEWYRRADITVNAELLIPAELARQIAERLQLTVDE